MPSYAREGGAPGAGTDPEAASLETPPPEVLCGVAASSSWGWPEEGTAALSVRVFDCRGLEGALEGAHHIFFFAGDCDDSATSWHLEDIVTMVGHRHELGQGWIPEDGIVWQADVGDIEVDELGR